MKTRSRIVRCLLGALVLLVPASGQIAKATPPTTPTTHAEWLDRLFAATISPKFLSTTGGEYHSCGLTSRQSVTCWGNDASRQATVPDGTFTQVSAGGHHSCALATDQTIDCWGDDTYGATTVPEGTFTHVSAGGHHTCALATDQTIDCWGYAYGGQTTAPAGTFTQVSAGGYFTCGLTTDQTISCWGQNPYGQATAPAIQNNISDPGIEQYVTDLETAPVCELKVPTALGTKARVSLNKALSGTVRWSIPATKANVEIQITRNLGSGVEYWVTGSTWSNTPTTKTATSGTTYAGTTEAPWKLVFAVPAGIGITYNISCKAVDILGNTSPTADKGRLISIA